MKKNKKHEKKNDNTFDGDRQSNCGTHSNIIITTTKHLLLFGETKISYLIIIKSCSVWQEEIITYFGIIRLQEASFDKLVCKVEFSVNQR